MVNARRGPLLLSELALNCLISVTPSNGIIAIDALPLLAGA